MFDPFFLWLEATAFSVWMRESPSLFAFPMILAVHTIGLGLLAGINGALNLRLLGFAPGIPVAAFRRFLPVMWLGFWSNVLSGIALLLAYPTKALTNPVFYLKLSLIGGALVILRRTGRFALIEGLPPDNLKTLAAASFVCWAGAIISGRFLAYTYTRLMATWEFAWPY
jgi:hypothetical protein